MGRTVRDDGFDYMDLDDFEEALLDKPDNEKWELIGGRVVRRMVGARWEHERIAGNVYAKLLLDLRSNKSPCRPFKETFHVKQRFMKLSVSPDIFVRCGKLEAGATSTDDPIVVFEVVSGGSRQRDWREKWRHCSRLPSLMHYVLIDRDTVSVTVKDRQGENWLERPPLEAHADTLALGAIDFAMPVSEIYRDVIEPTG
jgi:Uma2 family endonuclease